MYGHSDIQIIINEKATAESVEIDLSLAAKSLDDFKKHVLSESNLSPGEYEKYMLSYLYGNYSQGNEEDAKMTTIYLPLLKADDLRNYIMTTV